MYPQMKILRVLFLSFPLLCSSFAMAKSSNKVIKPKSAPQAKVESVEDMLDRVQRSVVQIETTEALGTGSIVSDTGFVITNAHVVGTAAIVKVSVNHGDDSEPISVPAVVVMTSAEVDLAVLKIIFSLKLEDSKNHKIEKYKYPPLTFAQNSTIRRGQVVYALGSPYGLSQTATQGIISAPSRTLRSYDRSGRPVPGSERDFIQTDTPINSGNSGGPLLNPQGQILGVNTIKIGADGIGLAIPAKYAETFARLAQQFYKQHPVLGIQVEWDPATGNDSETHQRQLTVSKVTDDSVASRLGIQAGDTIVSLDQTPVPDFITFTAMVRSTSLNGEHELVIIPAGKTRKKKIRFNWFKYLTSDTNNP
jgi:S1-C subfamily serine protease